MNPYIRCSGTGLTNPVSQKNARSASRSSMIGQRRRLSNRPSSLNGKRSLNQIALASDPDAHAKTQSSRFDRIDQAALLEKMHTSPHFARPIKEWLKAGAVDAGIFMPTDQGTPQGGVASPLLANIALHGLEDVVQKSRGPATTVVEGKQVRSNVFCIRYADDFVVFHNTWEGIQRCKEAIQEWLQGMGLELKDAKTRFAHTLEAKEECGGNVGFDFLGFTVRQFPVGRNQTKTHASYKTIIKPSKSSLHRHYQELATVLERMKAATIDEVIRAINPKIIGWCNYYKNEVSKRAFQKLEHMLWYKIFSWAKRKHPK